jgi:nucleoside-diphosphate-sugar epimerase
MSASRADARAETIRNEAELDEVLTRPSPALLQFIGSVPSPLVVLGAGGKMGPSLAVLARRAAAAAGHPLEVIAVSRFSNAASRQWLEEREVRTIAADLLKEDEVRRLPDAANVLYLVGQKFGTRENPGATWVANTLAPAFVAQRYASSRLVALSTGNVYPLSKVRDGGARETTPLTPLGEYPNAAVARERLFEFFAAEHRTPLVILRLNYAVDLRYGVLPDIARKVFGGEPIDLTMGWFNCIWQGDANELILRSLELASVPRRVFNLTSPQVLSVRAVAERLGERLGRAPQFVGAEAETALLSCADALAGQLGPPATPLDTLLRWTADWVKMGGRSLDKPTHFEVRDGVY